jgi:hypothetical protein
MTCDSPFINDFSDDSPAGESHAQSAPCILNKASAFLIQMIFSILLIHLNSLSRSFDTIRKRLASAAHLGSADKKVAVVSAFLNIKVQYVIGIAMPFTLMCIMYAIEGLPIESETFAGNIARWTVICGPRLEMIPEVGGFDSSIVRVVFVRSDFCFLGLGGMIGSPRSRPFASARSGRHCHLHPADSTNQKLYRQKQSRQHTVRKPF